MCGVGVGCFVGWLVSFPELWLTCVVWVVEKADGFAALAFHQLGIKAFALQWIFAFVIMSVLFLATLAIVVPGYFGKELSFRREDTIEEEEDQERQPLLRDE